MANRTVSPREAWASPDQFATTLLLLFIDQYGTEGLTWDSRTIKMEIEDDFNVKLSAGNFDRLMVARGLLTTNDFYWSLPDFVNWCNILNGDTYDPRLWDPADAAECAWGITEAMFIEPPDEEDPFSPEILAYIGATLDAEGIINPPDILRIALRSNPHTPKGLTDFSDDPIMFNAVYDLETAKTEAITNYLRLSLQRLAEQLAQLPLQSGSTKDIVKRVLTSQR